MLGEPGTVGALLRRIGQDSGAHSGHVLAALHHRHPELVPHLTRTTRRALLPHLEEGDSGVEAVVRRELRANADAFAALEDAVAAATGDARPTRLRLHDVLLWLSTTLRLAHAVAAGDACSARPTIPTAGRERLQQRSEATALGGERVLGARWTRVEHPPFEQPRRLEVGQARRERRGRHLAEGLLELREPDRTEVRGIEHRERPASLQQCRQRAHLGRYRLP